MMDLHDQPRPYRLFLPHDAAVEDAAIEQLMTALRLPVAHSGAGMPDIHPGYSLPIGGVVALKDAISPAFIGYDISCMVKLTKVYVPWASQDALEDSKVRERMLQAVLRSTSFGLGARTSGLDHPCMHLRQWDTIPTLRELKMLARQQLGSSGAGNHFVDVVYGKDISGRQTWIGLLSHSGSRGVGNKLGHHYAGLADEMTRKKHQIPKGYGWFERGTPLFDEYVEALMVMGEYARANHQLIHEQFVRAVQGEALETIQVQHNYAEYVDDLVVHRKGATPAHEGVLGLVPGTSGSPSYITRGLGNPESLMSSSHGAGRPRSRTASRKQHDQEEFISYMRGQGISHRGVAPDETWKAYKDIESVMAAQTELAEAVAVMTPKVVVMGGNVRADDGD